MNITGSGILPVALINNQLHFLFGKDSYKNEWSDFGGKKENNETNFETAIREGYEETNGFLGDKILIKNKVINNYILNINSHNYTTYLYNEKIDYNLPSYFNYNFKYIKKNHPLIIKSYNGLYEKSEIKWFSVKDIIKNYRKFRKWYAKKIIKQILNNIDNIKKLIK